MTEKMDKSLEDIITEQRTKPKPRVRSGDRTEGAARGSDRRNARPDSRRETKSDVGRKQVAAGPPPREPQYYMHDDRADFGGRGQQGGGVPRGSWKQQQRQQWEQQQQYERPRGRGAAAAGGSDPIITTADGWEEVAQDEPYYKDRRGGSGAQRRGGVFDRLAYKGQGGGHNTRSHDRQQQQQFGGGRFGRGRGRGGGGRGRGGDFEGEPRRKYIDEHDHREDASAGPPGRPGRFAPYRVAGGVSKRTARGPAPAGRKWGHDLFDPNQPAPAAEGGEAGDGMME